MRAGKKFPFLILPSLLCLLGVMLSACGGSGAGTVTTTKAPESQQVLRYEFRNPDLTTFDPAIVTDAISTQAIDMVFTGLVTYDNNLSVQPGLAKSWDVSSGGKTYTFHLRPNLKFSDGTPLTASDVAYSIDRALSPAINNQNGTALTYLGLIKNSAERTTGKVNSIIGTGIIAKDPQTVVINLNSPTAYFLQALTYPTGYVVEKSVFEKWGSKWTDHLSDNGGQGGDGPFKVLSYSHTTGVKLVPNKNYWGLQPQLKEFDYLPMKDVNTAYNAYLANQLDYSEVPATLYRQVKTRSDFGSTPALTTFEINLNYLDKPLDNVHIRQALELALNRDVINDSVYSGSNIATCHIVPQGQYGYDANLTCPDNTTPAGDKTKAQQLFKQGMQEEGLSTFPQLSYTYPASNPLAANEAETEIQMWKSVLGINILPNAIQQTTLWTDQSNTTGNAGPLQIWNAGWGADFPDPEDWTTLQFGNGAPNNYSNYGQNHGSSAAEEQKVQSELAAADVMGNQTARAAAYNKAEQQLVNDVAWITIYQRPDLRVLKPYVIGLKFNADSVIPPNSWASVYIAQH